MCVYIYITFLLIFSWYSYTGYVPEWSVVLVSLGMSLQMRFSDCPLKLFWAKFQRYIPLFTLEISMPFCWLTFDHFRSLPTVIVPAFSGFYFLGWQWRVTVQERTGADDSVCFSVFSLFRGILYPKRHGGVMYVLTVSVAAFRAAGVIPETPLRGAWWRGACPGVPLAGHAARASWNTCFCPEHRNKVFP